MQICISGMVAVGKTTLIEGMSQRLKLEKVVETPLGLQYLPRLFQEPKRWGFEAQAAFLIDKACGILEKHKIGAPFLVDRSIEEDAKIFYEYFREEHAIDPLTDATYQSLYNLLSLVIPKTSIHIICIIDRDIVFDRINNRDKFNSYVDGYVEYIFSRYEKYIEESRGNPNTYICDSSKHDWTQSVTCDLIANDLQKLINGFQNSIKADLFILEEHR